MLIERVRFTTSRVAVVGTLAVGLAFTPLYGRAAEPKPEHQKLARELLAALIETDTTHATGSTTVAAELLAKRLRVAGFPAEDVQVLEGAPRKGNLVARLRGKNRSLPPLLLLAHLDVVAADRADWSIEPFKFIERDGYFWGRGTTDDKDECAIHVANLIRMKQEGFVPERDIVVALTSDEESGNENGVEWLLEKHPALMKAALALNEGGGGASKQGVRISNQVQASEKFVQNFELEVTDPGGHSSLPRAENAVYRLSAALLAVRDLVFPVRLNEVTRSFFERSAAHEKDKALAEAMRGVIAEPPLESAITKLSAIPAYNSRLRTTCVVTELAGGHAKNALPQRAKANINCRILPDQTADEIEAALRTRIADAKVTMRRLDSTHGMASPPSPLTPGVLEAIEATTQELWPGVPVIPTMSTGATDGLFLRKAGVPVYGVSGIFGDIDDVRAHGRDERLETKSFYEGLEFLYRLSTRLGRASNQQLSGMENAS